MKKFFLSLILLLTLAIAMPAMAQGGGPPDPPGGGDSNVDDVPAPINTLILLGLGIGAVSGARLVTRK